MGAGKREGLDGKVPFDKPPKQTAFVTGMKDLQVGHCVPSIGRFVPERLSSRLGKRKYKVEGLKKKKSPRLMLLGEG